MCVFKLNIKIDINAYAWIHREEMVRRYDEKK